MKSIGRYQLTDTLGQGGMGVVYRAFDTLLQRVVAVKLISGSIQAGPEQRERFFREARAAGQLSHRNIITIHDLGEHDGQPYLAMEYLEGEDLQRRLARPERMSLLRQVELAMDVCDALEYAHARGVVHRDIKPANVFITDNGVAKILDFGLARLMTSELTNSNLMMGTANYMAPEQVRGERADHQSDIFSVGVVLYELLGRRRAFEADSFAATLYKILQDEPEPLLTIDPGLPPDLVAIVERAMAKSRVDRYGQMSEMLRDLAVCRQQLAALDPPPLGRPGSGGQTRLSGLASAPPLTPEEAPTMAPGTPARGVSRASSGPSRAPADGRSAVPAAGSGAAAGARPTPPARRWMAGAAAIVVLAGGAAYWAARPVPEQPVAPATAVPDVAPAVDHAAIATALQQAARALEDGDFDTAERHADAALSIAPGHAEARELRERVAGTRASVTRGLDDARTHFDAGRYEEASRLAGHVLGLVPGHDGARRLMQDAAARAKGRGADEARARMNRAKAAARDADAPGLAPAAYEAALGAERSAERVHGAGQLGDATARFYEASGLFRSAELAAQREAAARDARARLEERESGRADVPAVPAPHPTASVPPASPLVVRPVEPPPPQAPPAAPTRPAPVPVPAAEPSASDLIARLLAAYEAALETRSLTALKQIWPDLGGGQEAAIRNEFTHASRIDVEIGTPHVEVTGSRATASFLRRYELVTTDGQRLSSQSLTTMTLRRTATGWVITQLRFEPVR